MPTEYKLSLDSLAGVAPAPLSAKKTKILFLATSPNQPGGYSKIAHRIANYLAAQPQYEVYYFAISNYPEQAVKRDVHPAIKMIDVRAEEKKLGIIPPGQNNEKFGVDIIEKYMRALKPDVFFLYNDILLVTQHLNRLFNYKTVSSKIIGHEFKTVVYIDMVYDLEKLDCVMNLDAYSDYLFAFSDYWKKNLIRMGVPAEKIGVLHHGLDPYIHRVPREQARAALGIPQDAFVVLNTNKNAYRKAQDITMDAFMQFFKDNGCDPRIRLYFNCQLESSYGYNLRDLIEILCVKHGLDYKRFVTETFMMLPARQAYAEDEDINNMYNACDVGINTCLGEGFGLCNFEHASVGGAQVVSAVGGLVDIFGERSYDNNGERNTKGPYAEQSNGSKDLATQGPFAELIKPVATLYSVSMLNQNNGFAQICRSEDFAASLSRLYRDKEYRDALSDAAVKHIHTNYKWDDILAKFSIDLDTYLSEAAAGRAPVALMTARTGTAAATTAT
jgi:glycosyltransferase involved in cell wall biosynthesis